MARSARRGPDLSTQPPSAARSAMAVVVLHDHNLTPVALPAGRVNPSTPEVLGLDLAPREFASVKQ